MSSECRSKIELKSLDFGPLSLLSFLILIQQSLGSRIHYKPTKRKRQKYKIEMRFRENRTNWKRIAQLQVWKKKFAAVRINFSLISANTKRSLMGSSQHWPTGQTNCFLSLSFSRSTVSFSVQEKTNSHPREKEMQTSRKKKSKKSCVRFCVYTLNYFPNQMTTAPVILSLARSRSHSLHFVFIPQQCYRFEYVVWMRSTNE